jgi:pilus assembly protein CpaC
MKRHCLTVCGIVGYAVATLIGMPGPAAAQTAAEDLRLTVGKSIVIDYPSDIRQISTSNPEIVDASPVTSREILVHGKGLGTGTLIVWNKSGERTFYNVTVEANLDPLRRLLKETFPNEDIQVQSSRDSIALVGRISSPQVGERAAALAAPFGKTIVNNLRLLVGPVEKQIVLKVKFAELDRTRATQYGVNIVSLGGANTVGRTTTGQFNAPTPDITSGGGGSTNTTLTITDALNIFAFRPDLNLAAFIKALQNESVLQILAEPNLVTTNGKEASFLVGGEFPVPVLQGAGNAGAVTIQFREFGIRLLFTPTLTENKTVKLHLRQEVSTIDLANAVTLNGFTIPALSTRRAETDIELAEGQTFVVAGLLDNRETESYSKIPGLGDLPILGTLFKSREIRQNRTELVMLVTPETTRPLNPGEAAPLPVFPGKFLVPINPAAKGPSVAPATPVAQEKASNKGPGRHWYGLRKSK